MVILYGFSFSEAVTIGFPTVILAFYFTWSRKHCSSLHSEALGSLAVAGKRRKNEKKKKKKVLTPFAWFIKLDRCLNCKQEI